MNHQKLRTAAHDAEWQEDQSKTWIKVSYWCESLLNKWNYSQVNLSINYDAGKVCNNQIVYIKVNSTSAHCVDYLQCQIIKDI